MIWKYKIRKVDMISFMKKYCIALVCITDMCASVTVAARD